MQIIIATPAPIAELKRALEDLGIATHPLDESETAAVLAQASVLIDVEYLVADLDGDVDALLSQLEDETIWAPVAEVIAYRGEPEGFPWRG